MMQSPVACLRILLQLQPMMMDQLALAASANTLQTSHGHTPKGRDRQLNGKTVKQVKNKILQKTQNNNNGKK
jgi:hypothetical protein